MHQYGKEGFCLIWAINNALQRRLLSPEKVVDYLVQRDNEDKKRDIYDFIDRDGIDFEEFREYLREEHGIKLQKVDKVQKQGRYLVTYDFGDYYHTIAVYNGKVLDSRKKMEIKSLKNRRPLVDIYKVYL